MNQYTILYLVRHGETEANVTNTLQGQSDVRLNEKGIRQAQLVGKRLRDKHFDVILSSDLSRAAVTAAEIAGERQMTLTPLLREWDLGDWVGLTWDQVKEKFPEEAALFSSGSMDAEVSGGESRRQFHERAAKVLRQVTEEYAGKTVLCVSHGGLLRAIFQAAAKTALPGNFLRTDNTCVCCLKYAHDSGKWQLVLWNDTSHLDSQALSSGW